MLNKDVLFKIKKQKAKLHVLTWLKRLIYSEEPIVFFFNIPYIISVLIKDIKINIRKKTIYLYQAIILLTFPLLIYRLQHKFHENKQNNSLNYIINNINAICSIKQKLDLNNLKKNQLLQIEDNLSYKDNKVLIDLEYKNKTTCSKFLEKIQKEKKNCDNARILNLMTHRKLHKNKNLYDIKTVISKEWTYQEKLFDQTSNFTIQSKLNQIDEKNNSFYLVPMITLRNKQRKEFHKQISKILDTWYILFIEPHKLKKDRLFLSEKVRTYKVAEGNTKIFNNENKKDSIFLESNEQFIFSKEFNWITKFKITKETIYFFKKLTVYLKNCYKYKTKVVNEILYWLKGVGHYANKNFYLKNLSQIEPNTLENTKSKNTNSLENKRKEWRYKLTQWTKTNTYNSKLDFKEGNNTEIKINFLKNRKLKDIFTLFWIEKYNVYFKSLINLIQVSSLDLISKEKYILKKIQVLDFVKNKSCWNSLVYNFEKINGKDLITKKQKQYTLNTITNQNYFNRNQNIKILQNTNTIQNIKQIHYLPSEESIKPFICTQNKNESKLNHILFTNIKKTNFNYYISKQNIEKWNSISKIISSKIFNTFKEKFFIINKKKHKDNNIIKLLYKKILKTTDTHLFEKQSIILENIKIEKKYTNQLSLYLKQNLKTKKYFRYSHRVDKQNTLTKILEYNGAKRKNEKYVKFPFYYLEPLKTIRKQKTNEEIKDFFPAGPRGTEGQQKSEYNKDYESSTVSNITKLAEIDSLIVAEKENNFFNIKTIEKYKKWIFTAEWWLLIKNIINNSIPRIHEKVYELKKLILIPTVNYCSKQINKNFYKVDIEKSLNYSTLLSEELNKSNLYLLEEIYKSTKKYISIWDSSFFYRHLNSKEWVSIAWFITFCIIYYHWISIFTGTQYFYMWYKFEIMRFLSHPSPNTFLNILVNKSRQTPAKQMQLSIYASKGWIIWLKSQILLYFAQNKILSKTLFTTKGIDVPRTQQNVVVNSLITETRLISEYKLWNVNQTKYNQNINRSKRIKDYGLNYLQKWSRRYARNPGFIRLKKYFSKFNKSLWLNDLFFHMEYKFLPLNYKSNSFSLIKIEKQPRTLPEPFIFTKRWLLVGEVETGKSYIVKNLAADTQLPLVHVSLKDIRHATPDIQYNKLKQYNKWIKQLADRGYLLENILELAKMLSPCILWISDLHEFHATHNIQNQQGKIYDASLLMRILLKMMSSDLLPEKNSNITLIGSTNSPTLLDPKFVSRHRLDLIINLRKASFYNRQKIFNNLLNTHKFYVKTKRSFYELGSNTIGYNIRDIASLVNETLLIKRKDLNKLVNTNEIRLAVYRQISKQSDNNSILEKESLQYKIGKSIIQTILNYSKPQLLITKKHDLWKTRFYYLSNAFLEFSIEQSTVKELTVFTHLVTYLSGSAARDAWLLSVQKLNTDLNISKELKNELCLSSNILQSLLLEFPMREICDVKKNNRNQSVSNFRGKYKLNIMQNAIYSLNFFERFTSYIYWSYRIERLSLSWILLFDNIQISNKYIVVQSSSKFKNHNSIISRITDNIDKSVPYERRITNRQEKRAQKIHSTFHNNIIENNIKTMGLPWISEYVMNYEALQLSILLLETRPLWNPPVLTPTYSVLFFDRDLIINRNTLTKIYMTYGEKFQSEKLNPKRIKKQVLWSDTTIQNPKLNDKLTNQEDNIVLNFEDFNYYKQMAKTQAQLEQLQLQPPIYLYQSWTYADHEEMIRHSDLLKHRATLDNDFLKERELLIYGILLEIYHYLLRFFVNYQKITTNIEKALLENNSLNREYIESVLKNTKLF